MDTEDETPECRLEQMPGLIDSKVSKRLLVLPYMLIFPINLVDPTRKSEDVIRACRTFLQ